MSGSLATLTRGADIARGAVQSGTALANLFTGGTAGGTLTLGSFVFADFELPESISCGGAQTINVHKLTGGGRVVDAMGGDEAPISWSGIFLSNQAAVRSAQLSEMRRAGALVPLAWGGINVPVVITDVTLEWRRPYHVGYRIACTVVPPGPLGIPSPQTSRHRQAFRPGEASDTGPVRWRGSLAELVGCADIAESLTLTLPNPSNDRCSRDS